MTNYYDDHLFDYRNRADRMDRASSYKEKRFRTNSTDGAHRRGQKGLNLLPLGICGILWT